ncbi:MAG: purine-nucleoside phosphorylase [Thermoanaerobaculum sp.]
MEFTPSVLEERAAKLKEHLPSVPVSCALVAGSGIDLALPRARKRAEFPYREIFPFPVYELMGHTPTLSFWEVAGRGVLIFHGRFHLYQGYSPAEVAAIPRLAALLGASTYVLTNAAGSLRPEVVPGTLVVLSDHLNLQGANPLVGAWGRWREPSFPDMTGAYDPELRALALRLAREAGFTAQEGVYAGVLGPSFETPAEVRMLGQLGGTVVGMSTVQEVIAARHMGMRVLGLSLITNFAAGLAVTPLTHEEVLEAGAQAREKLVGLLSALVASMLSP